mgnify:FL=1|jgi:hypothetical protein
MENTKPLLTVVKSRMVDEAKPPLEPGEQALLDTLSMLCSFHTTEDLASFLCSSMFQGLVGSRPPFVVFEIGVYLDHTKTIELVASEDGIVLADASASGAFHENTHMIEDEDDAAKQLAHWHRTVYTDSGRFG